jgi:3-phosphoshikimate 1-carboxyvinyltransferase
MLHHARVSTGPLTGRLRVPGDKSISHRAVLFAAMAEGTSELTGVLDSADVRSTLGAVETLGAQVTHERAGDDSLSASVTGWGSAGPVSPISPVECGNSGTTARLLMGALAGWPVVATLVGDESLSRRPMARVIDPLSAMGAEFTSREGCLPVTVQGAVSPVPLDYDSPVASAQVKTAVLLAGLRADGRTVVREPAPSRDHTELMLPHFGVAVGRDEATNAAWVQGPAALSATDVAVPADPSSAAFLVVAALIVPGSAITLDDVALNPTRTGFLRVLHRMGADIDVDVHEGAGAELTGTIVVRHTPALTATVVTVEEIPSLVDEVPILAVAAARAAGVTRFEGVGELRVKESDRLEAIRSALEAMGVDVSVDGDTLEITGRPDAPLASARVDSLGDHRLAMAWSVAGLVSDDEVEVERFEAVDVSYPGFRDALLLLGAG